MLALPGKQLCYRHPFKTCETQEIRWMWAHPRNQFCYPASSESMQNTIENEHGHSQGISFVAQYHLNVRTMQWKHGMWALPGNQFSAPASSQSMWKAIETLNVGTASEWTLLPGVLSKHEHGRNLEGGHSQGLNCVTQHPLKACKTQCKRWCGHFQGVNFVTGHPLKACRAQ